MLTLPRIAALLIAASFALAGCGVQVTDDSNADAGRPRSDPPDASANAPPPVAKATLVDSCWIDKAERVVCTHNVHANASMYNDDVAKLGQGVTAVFNSPGANVFGAVDGDHVFRCLGSDNYDFHATEVVTSPNASPLVSVACGAGFTCGLRADGGASCSGSVPEPDSSETGETEVMVPGTDAAGNVTAFGGKKALDLKAATYQVCGLLEDGEVVCWGARNRFGLGAEGQTTPVPVPGIAADIVQIGLGDGLGCARSREGEVYCWGSYLDFNPKVVPGRPSLVSGLPPVVDLVVGEGNACARDAADGVWCWGDNLCGESDPWAPYPDPSQKVRRLTGIHGQVVELAGGNVSFFARTSDGTIWAWGCVGGRPLFAIGSTSD